MDNSVYLVGTLQDRSLWSLARLDLLTGEVEWQTTLSRRHAYPLAYDSQYIFVDMSTRGNRPIWDSDRVVAYDKNSGEQVWAQRIPGTHGIGYAYIIDDRLSISAGHGRNFQLARETGEILEQTRLIGLLMAQNEQVDYLLEKSRDIRAVNVHTGETLWIERVPRVPNPPVFTDEIIIAGGNNLNLLGNALALDRRSGNLLWEYERVISNVAVNDSTVFFLQMDEDAIWQNGYMSDVHLLAVDLVTGDIIASMQFDPPGITFGSRGHIYKITASSDLVLVHLADGYQLMALRFSPDE